MSPSEYRDLVECLTGQFGQIERQFHDLTLEIGRRLTVVDEQIATFPAEVGGRFPEALGHFDEIERRLGA